MVEKGNRSWRGGGLFRHPPLPPPHTHTSLSSHQATNMRALVLFISPFRNGDDQDRKFGSICPKACSNSRQCFIRIFTIDGPFVHRKTVECRLWVYPGQFYDVLVANSTVDVLAVTGGAPWYCLRHKRALRSVWRRWSWREGSCFRSWPGRSMLICTYTVPIAFHCSDFAEFSYCGGKFYGMKLLFLPCSQALSIGLRLEPFESSLHYHILLLSYQFWY